MTSGQLVKASITPINPAGGRIEFMFNPREYTISKTAGWDAAPSGTQDAGDANFSGGHGATLSLQLFFDTYLNRAGDVRVHTDRLWKLLLMDEQTRHPKTGKGRPPEVLFQWGATWYFKAILKSMQQQFSLFLPDGTPVRALVTLELQQTEDKALMAASSSSAQLSEQLRAGGGGQNLDPRRDRLG